MNNNKMSKGKIILLVIGVIFAVNLLLMIILPQFIKYMISERSVDYYSIETLEEECGLTNFKASEVEWLTDATRYSNPGKKIDITDYLTFYVFRSDTAAKKGLKEFKKVNFVSYNIVSEGNNFIEGRIEGVKDAEVIVFVYRSKNMLISCEKVIGNSFADNFDRKKADETNNAMDIRYEECKNYIRYTFE